MLNLPASHLQFKKVSCWFHVFAFPTNFLKPAIYVCIKTFIRFFLEIFWFIKRKPIIPDVYLQWKGALRWRAGRRASRAVGARLAHHGLRDRVFSDAYDRRVAAGATPFGVRQPPEQNYLGRREWRDCKNASDTLHFRNGVVNLNNSVGASCVEIKLYKAIFISQP